MGCCCGKPKPKNQHPETAPQPPPKIELQEEKEEVIEQQQIEQPAPLKFVEEESDDLIVVDEQQMHEKQIAVHSQFIKDKMIQEPIAIENIEFEEPEPVPTEIGKLTIVDLKFENAKEMVDQKNCSKKIEVDQYYYIDHIITHVLYLDYDRTRKPNRNSQKKQPKSFSRQITHIQQSAENEMKRQLSKELLENTPKNDHNSPKFSRQISVIEEELEVQCIDSSIAKQIEIKKYKDQVFDIKQVIIQVTYEKVYVQKNGKKVNDTVIRQLLTEFPTELKDGETKTLKSQPMTDMTNTEIKDYITITWEKQIPVQPEQNPKAQKQQSQQQQGQINKPSKFKN